VNTHPPIPTPDALSAPFWDAVNIGKLVVQRCDSCERYQFPPRAECPGCGAAGLPFVPVTGRGTVLSFTETVSGARHPYFQSRTPYLAGLVQLEEQEDLVLASNFPGATFDDLSVGAPVQVEFQEISDGVFLPQFSLRATPGQEDG
jgi:uncharacterized OB-fold protein